MSAGDWKDMLSAVQNGKLEIVKYHIQNGVNPNYEHPELFTTALIESISNERTEIVKYLLKNGADATMKSGFTKQSPLKVAKSKMNREIIDILEKYIPQNKWAKFIVMIKSLTINWNKT